MNGSLQLTGAFSGLPRELRNTMQANVLAPGEYSSDQWIKRKAPARGRAQKYIIGGLGGFIEKDWLWKAAASDQWFVYWCCVSEALRERRGGASHFTQLNVRGVTNRHKA